MGCRSANRVLAHHASTHHSTCTICSEKSACKHTSQCTHKVCLPRRPIRRLEVCTNLYASFVKMHMSVFSVHTHTCTHLVPLRMTKVAPNVACRNRFQNPCKWICLLNIQSLPVNGLLMKKPVMLNPVEDDL